MKAISYSVHGAPYFPWGNFFRKVSASDVIVILDDVQMPLGRSMLNRCKVRVNRTECFLTVPIRRGRGSHLLRSEVEICQIGDWKRKHLDTFWHLYHKRPFWGIISTDLLDALDEDWQYITDLSIALIERVLRICGLKTVLIRSSSLGLARMGPTERILSIGHALGAKYYISGIGAQSYLNSNLFAGSGIALEYIHPITLAPASNGWVDLGLSCVDELSNFGCLQGLGNKERV